LGRADIAFPKGPRSALPRPHRVDSATFLPVIKDAITVGLFPQAAARLGCTGIKTDHFRHWFVAVVGNGCNLFVVYPDVAGRPGAALAAAGAAKTQAVLIPWLGHAIFSRLVRELTLSVSVIIPTFNEESCLEDTLLLLRQHRPHEIIVVDGGSGDATCRLARAADLLLHGPRGRAAQMNLGAAQATGNVLLFLHADCALEKGALGEAERLLGRPGVVAGCFTMTVRAHGWLYRCIDTCATARVRLTGLVYGDQGLFLQRESFKRQGGFPSLSFMEDLFFSQQLRRRGRIDVSPRRIFVSPRRWQRSGLVRQSLWNWLLTGLAAGGIHPDRLAPFYPAVR
jgi:rSAM/selenodomain-associated transferase 2